MKQVSIKTEYPNQRMIENFDLALIHLGQDISLSGWLTEKPR